MKLNITIVLSLLFLFPFAVNAVDVTNKNTQSSSSSKNDVSGPAPGVSLYDEGFWMIKETDKLRIWAWAQEDYRAFDKNYPLPDTFLNRRVRLAALGTLDYHFNYMIMAALERSTNLVWYAWVEYAQLEWLKARVGQFKEPYSLEELITDLYLDILERSIITSNFSPAVDIGAMLHGYFWDTRIEYAVGAFNGRGVNTNDNRNDKNLAARVVVQPFELANANNKFLKNLYIGFSGTTGFNEENLAGTSFRTAGQTNFWTYNTGVDYIGERWRLGADLEWCYGPYSIKAEWGHSTFDNINSATASTNGDFNGWYLLATWLLTGEENPRGNKPIKPNKNFDPLKNTWGAFEILGRYEQFIADNSPIILGLATGTDQVDAITLGFNWYFNKRVRGSFNYVRSMFANPVVVNNISIADEDLYLFRAQFEI